MWSDILTGYGIFILEILTILLVIAAANTFFKKESQGTERS